MAKKTEQQKLNALVEEARKILNQAKNPENALKNLRPELKKALKQYYGYAWSLITSSPDLMKAFTKAVRQGMTEQGFTQAITATDWYKSRTASQRKYQFLINDPGSKADLENLRSEVVRQIKVAAMQAGGVVPTDEEVTSLAETLLENNFDNWQDVLPRTVGEMFVGEDVTNYGGAASSALMEIQKHARAMGITLTDQELGRYVDDIFAEKNTLENVLNGITDLAVAYYPQFADRLKSGATMEGVTAAYRNVAAQMLELEPDAISFMDGTNTKTDPLISKALFGGADGKPVSLYDFRKMIKADARWKETRNAREEYAGISQSVLRAFGAGF
jgi:hypothetical protein